MKLNISALIIGLLLLGFGLFLWNFAQSQWGFDSGWITTLEEQAIAEIVGIGLTGFGSGLTIAGVANLIAAVQREKKLKKAPLP